jgi:epoxyqueuosine reductase
MDKNVLTEKIKEIAEASGIDALGFARASEFAGYTLSQSKRRDPKLSLPDAETIIVAGVYIGGLTLPAWSNPWYGRTSRLYLSGYFSDVIEPLEPIVNYLKEQGYKAILCNSSTGEGSIIPLKLAAIRAGLGWQGKHSLLVTKKFGTFLALGGIVTNVILEHNEKEEPNRCGKCDKCQVACPLSAFERPYVLNRIRCLSSNLLQDGDLSEEFKSVMENRMGDCEICQDVCPWNKKHLENPLQTRLTKAFREQEKAWEELFYLPNLAKLTEEEYNNAFVGRVKTGIPYEIFYRNASSALKNASKTD